MAKKLNKLDLLKLSSIDTASEDFIAFAAKSDGLYQKIGQEENKIATTKELSDKVKTDVPEDAKFTDTVYTHPKTHDASIIVESPTKKFVSDSEKTEWTGKETPEGAQEKATKALTDAKLHVSEKVKTDVPENAKFTDTVYEHPDEHPADIIIETELKKFVSDEQISAWNAKETTKDSQLKAEGALENAKAYIDSKVLTAVPDGAVFTDTVYTHPEEHPASIIKQDVDNRFVTDEEKASWNAKETTAGATSKANQALEDAKEYVDNKASGKSDIEHNHNLSDLTEKSYNSLTDKPTLGTASSKNTGSVEGDIPILGVGGKLDNNVIPKIAISETSVVDSEEEMLALTAEIGDIAINTKLNTSFILKKEPSSTIDNWQELLTPMSPVTSVAGKKGDVRLFKEDVGLSNVDNTSDINKPISTAQGVAISEKVDKITGKGLSTNDYTDLEKGKLYGIEDGANKYEHPDTHKASIIIETETKRFVTDAEKSTWNAKETLAGADAKANQALEDAKEYVNGKVQTDVPGGALFTDTIVDISGKVDKVTGKGLSTNDYTTAEKTKLSGVEAGANNYVHPETHSAEIITETDDKKFVTDAEKTIWDEKETPEGAQTKATKALTDATDYVKDRVKIPVPDDAVFTDTVYSHPKTHAPSIIEQDATNRFVTDTEKDVWNAKETPSGAQARATKALTDATAYVDGRVKVDVPASAKFTDTVYEHPETHSAEIITETDDKKFVTEEEKDTWNAKETPAGTDAKVKDALTIAKNYVDDKVKTDVPVGAEFTDTIVDISGKSDIEHNHNLSDLTEKSYNSLTDKPILGTTASKNTGVSEGDIPILGVGGKLDVNTIPKIAISETSVVDSDETMLALTAEIGDIAIRTDLNMSFILKGDDANILSNWQELITPMSPVTSVAGKTGAVTLEKKDVGLSNVDNTSDKDKPVSTAQGVAISEKVDKVTGKGLSTNDYTFLEKDKLYGIEDGANKYVHPKTHDASIITETETKRFVTDEEKVSWNAKETTAGATSKANQALEDAKEYVNGKVLTNVPVDAKFSDTIYTHPATHPATIITETDDKNFVSLIEKDGWDAKESPTGAQTKATKALEDAKIYTDNKVKTDVPEYAKFTETTINGKTGIIAKSDIVALGIPSQDTIIDISGKVDKVDGKGLSTNDYTTTEKNKLSGIDVGANKYVHPETHKPSIIEQDITNRFVTDAEKVNWNSKETISGSQAKANEALEGAKAHVDSKVLTDVPVDAVFTDTVYTHPEEHPATIITESTDKRFVTDAEKAIWSKKETPEGAQTKATKALTDATTYIDDKVDSINDSILTKSDVGHNHNLSDLTEKSYNSLTDIPILGTASSKDVGSVEGNIPILGVGGKLDVNTIPKIAISETSVVSSELEMLAVTAEIGDIAIRTDLNTSFILKGGDSKELSNWQELITPMSPVTSVAGKTGAITLEKKDVGLSNVDNTSDINKPVSTAQGVAISGKVDKVDGMDLSTNDYTDAEKTKLSGIAAGANNYVHPETHSAEIITETDDKKFVTDAEKADWNAKETPTGSQTKATKALTDATDYVKDIVKTPVPEGAKFTDTIVDITGKVDKVAGKGLSTNDYTTDEKTKLFGIDLGANNYTHPITHPADIIIETKNKKFVSDVETIEWSAKETPENAQIKASKALADAKTYINNKVKSNVPAEALFTDTITTINGKTGIITKEDVVALGIPAQDTIIDISEKVDKIAGKGLSTNNYTTDDKNKLAGIEAGANNYTHPETHSADIITETTTKKFVSDTEKVEWTNKETPDGAQEKATKALTDATAYVDGRVKVDVPAGAKFTDTIVDISGKADKSYVDGKVKTDVPKDAVFTDTVYTHPDKHDASIIIETELKNFVSDAEKTEWSDKETTTGAQSKSDKALADAKVYINDKVKTDVPEFAKFTDTTTTINGKTGVITKSDIVALGIPAQDTIIDISGKVDKVDGKDLSTNDYTTIEKNKLAGIAAGANKYIHPTSHSADIITETTTKRFVSDAEKTTWGDKETPAGAQTKATKALTDATAYVDGKVNSINADILTKADEGHNHTLLSLSEKSYNSLTNKPTLGTAASKNTGTASGNIPILGTDGKLNDIVIPKIAISETSVIVSEEEMLALTAETGDIAIRTDLNTSFILKKEPASTLANWQELLTPMSPVQSVAGHVGVVTLTKVDVGLKNIDNTSDEDKPVSTAQGVAIGLKADITYVDERVKTPVPVGALFTDTKYTHPGSHPASMIIETTAKNFVSDTEKAGWDAKETPTGSQTKATKALTDATDYVKDRVKTPVPEGAKFTDTIVDISGKVDKVTGKDLSTNDYTTVEKNKLSGIEAGANKYAHPSGIYMSSAERTKLAGIEAGANKYEHPATHPADIIIETDDKNFVATSQISAWNAKETPIGAQTKADTALGSAKTYVDGKVQTDVPGGALFTDTIVDITGKVDKVAGKGLSTNDYTTAEKTKLSGIAAGANNYAHPGSHPASIITESTTKRFVSDVEKADWDSKETVEGSTAKASTALTNAKSYVDGKVKTDVPAGAKFTDTNTTYGVVTTIADGLMIATDKVKLNSIESGANKYTHPTGIYMSSAERTKLSGLATGANKYTHPTTHPASIIAQDISNRFVTDAEKADWNAKETPVNAQAKATKAFTDSKEYVDDRVKTDVPVGAKFTDTIVNISGKVDKVTGKGLSTNDYTTDEQGKLSGIEAGANKYTHPGSHPASMITESTTKRFVTDAEKATWSKKETPEGAQEKATKALTDATAYVDGKVLTDVPAGAKFTDTVVDITGKVDKVTGKDLSTNDYTTAEKTKLSGIAANANNYTHPTNHPASIITETTTKRFVTDAEKADWNAKETVEGSTAKASSALTDATAYVDTKVKTDVPLNAKFTDTNTTYGLMSSTELTTGTVATSRVVSAKLLSEWLGAKVKTNVPAGAVFTDTKYTHPTNHPASIITQTTSARFVSDAEKTTWGDKETPEGAQTKATKALTDATAYVDGKVNSINADILTKADKGHNHTLLSLSERNYDNLTNKPTLGTASSKNTGVASGNVPILGSDGKLNDSVIPKIAISETSVVATQALMLALTAETGDIAIRTDLSKTFILKKSPASTLANWQELETPASPVQSVAGRKGTVTLTKGDVGLANVDNTSDINKPVSTAQGVAIGLKVDKVSGKGLSTNDYTTAEKSKLSGIAAGANNYTHPGSHPASIITQTTSARFVSDAEKTTWGDKETPEGAQTKADTALGSAKTYVDGKVLTDVPVGAKFTDTVYSHPANHPATIITQTASARFVTDAEKSTWGKKETPEGAQAKADTALGSAKTYVDTKVQTNVPLNAVFTDTKYTHPTNHPASIITETADKRFVTDTEKGIWNSKGSSNLTLGVTSGTAYRGDYGNAAYAHITDAVKHITAAERTAWGNKWDYNATTIAGVKVTNAVNADKALILTNYKTIGITGGVTGTATAFDGSKNINIPITAMDASKLTTGTLPDARLGGVYTGFTHRIDGANTLFTTPSSGTQDALGRTVFGLAEFRGSASETKGAIVFISPFAKATAIMKSIEIDGMLYSPSEAVKVIINNYTSNLTRKMSYGTIDIQVRVGETSTGKFCVILGDVGTTWSYPHITLSKAMFSHGSTADAICYGWTTTLATSLTGYINISPVISNAPLATNISGSATILATPRAINGTNFNGSAAITTALWGTSRTLSFTGDVTGSSSVNGSKNVATAMTLANVATAGTYRSVTINAKGLVTSGTNPTTLSGYGITDGVTLNTTQTITGTKTFSSSLTANAGVSTTTITASGIITALGGSSTNWNTAYAHTSLKTNPHAVTKAQVGLGSVTDDKQATKAEFDVHATSKTNPHAVTFAQLGGKPTTFAPSAHSHGNITNDGKIGATTNLMIQTSTGGVLVAKTAGTTAQYLRGDGAWGTPPDTKYSASTGLSLSGTTFSVNLNNTISSTSTVLAATANSVRLAVAEANGYTNTKETNHKKENAPHQYGGKFEWAYNANTESLDLNYIG